MKLIIICGPTGSGKSALALRLAPKIGAEIVNADSGQVYRHLDIGTDKPPLGGQGGVLHHCLDLFDPGERGDVARFCQLADQVIREIGERRHCPLIVGGTGLYLRGLLHGLVSLPRKDPQLRAELETLFQKEGGEALHDRLRQVDLLSARRIHPHDPTRLIRALEVFHLTGRPLSQWQEAHRFQERRYEALKIGLQLDRKDLYDRINRRVETMLARGWLQEVENIVREYGDEAPALTNIGYRELVLYLKKKVDWETCVQQIKQNSRRFAKRQMTWFRADPEDRKSVV